MWVADWAGRSIGDLMRFWLRIFALAFGMGGHHRSRSELRDRYQLGGLLPIGRERTRSTLHVRGFDRIFPWRRVFIGIVLFGENRGQGKGMHFFACCMVAFGHAAKRDVDHRCDKLDADACGSARGCARASFTRSAGWRVIFTPSFPYRLAHMVCAKLPDRFLCRRGSIRLSSLGAGNISRAKAA